MNASNAVNAIHTLTRPRLLAQVAVVAAKELLDALRDRRTLLRLAVPALLLGPLMLALLGSVLADFETQAQRRTVLAQGLDAAPTLRNYLERQNVTIEPAPADHEAQLRAGRLERPVLVVPPGFEDALARGEPAALEIVSDSANTRASAGLGQLAGLVEGFGRERASLQLVVLGVPPDVLRPVDLTERDLASAGARASRITSMIPMFVIMAVLYGCLTAALDATAGERERGSLEPLLMNPVPPLALVAGKWVAVALMGAGVALLSSLSFIPAQGLIKSDALAAMFRFGWGEVLGFTLILAPLCAALGALLMAVAIRTRTFKEAQASATLVMTGVSLGPLVPLMNPGGDALWYFAVPGLGQNQLMMRVLKGEAASPEAWGLALASAVLLTALCLLYVARHMRQAVAR